MKMDELVAAYIKLRDKKDALKKAYEAEVEETSQLMDKIEGAVLNHLNKTGVTSIKTAAGTAYKSTLVSTRVADWPLLLEFVRTTDRWELINRSASKAAVQQYREEHDDLPPGIDWKERVNVNFNKR